MRTLYRILITLGAALIIVGFLMPIFAIAYEHFQIRRAEANWNRIVYEENLRTQRQMRDLQRLMNENAVLQKQIDAAKRPKP